MSDKIPLFVFVINRQIFARTTCADLGLPTDMEPAIAHKIRENIFRSIITWLDDVRSGVVIEEEVDLAPVPSDIKVNLVQPNHTVDMMSNLWKRAKPISADDTAAIPQPILPVDRDSNVDAWITITTKMDVDESSSSS